MAATYDINLGDEVSWVRFLIGDTTVATANLTDEEIYAALTDSIITVTAARRYYVAADLLDILHRRWMTHGAGYVSKKVGELSIVYGTSSGINADAALQAKIDSLRLQGAQRATTRPFSFATLGTRRRS